MKTPPDEVKLSREEGEALMGRIRASSLASDDQRLLVKLIELYFWLTFALRETRIGLGRLKRALFGEGRRPPPPGAGRWRVRRVGRWPVAPPWHRGTGPWWRVRRARRRSRRRP